MGLLERVFSWDLGQHYFAHTSKISLTWVQEHFNERLISMKTANNWAPHSPELTPLDFMPWGYLKSKAYAGKPDTEKSLKEAIRTDMKKISVAMIDRTIDNLQHTRLPAVILCTGGHFEHLRESLFKTALFLSGMPSNLDYVDSLFFFLPCKLFGLLRKT